MAVLKLDSENSLYYEHKRATDDETPTFVFVNALTGTTAHWAPNITSPLESEGFGTLVYNFRGQDKSSFSEGLALDEALIVNDLISILDAEKPNKPILVGLSIGGLFAAKAILSGKLADTAGLVFLNTLREPGVRLDWINNAVVTAVEIAGPQLIGDLFTPLLLNKEALPTAHGNAFKTAYAPIDQSSGVYSLLANSRGADWAVDYEALTLPILSITGLQDQVFYDAEDVNRLFERLPQATRVDLANAGHMIPVERPQELSDALLKFGASLRA